MMDQLTQTMLGRAMPEQRNAEPAQGAPMGGMQPSAPLTQAKHKAFQGMMGAGSALGGRLSEMPVPLKPQIGMQPSGASGIAALLQKLFQRRNSGIGSPVPAQAPMARTNEGY